jgi:hypothetical protein
MSDGNDQEVGQKIPTPVGAGEKIHPVPEKYKKLQKEWKFFEIIWSTIHYGLGITATVLAFVATSKHLANVADKNTIPALMLTSGALAVVLTFLTPASRRKAYTEACDILRITRLRYELEATYTVKDLNDAIDKAQQIIAKR